LKNLTPLLKKDPIIEIVSELASSLSYPIYLVGGYPRDLLLGKRTIDYDFVTFREVKPFAKKIAAILGGKSIIFSPFETAKIKLNTGGVIDIARARREYYIKPGILPKVEPTDSLLEDLERRDFTVNAMAISVNKEDFGCLYDPFEGEKDLEKKIIRVIKRGSFSEDPTRAFRAVRYKNRFNFRYDENMEVEFENAKKNMKSVSFERIKNELEKIAVEKKRLKMYIEIEEVGLLKSLDKSLSLDPDLIGYLDSYLIPPSDEQWIAFFSVFLLKTSTKPWDLEYTFVFNSKERKILEEVLTVKEEGKLPSTLGEIHRKFKNMEDLSLIILSVIFGGEEGKALREYKKRRKEVKVYLKGEDLIKMGIPEGELIGEIKNLLYTAHLEGKIKNEQDEIFFVKKWLKKKGK